MNVVRLSTLRTGRLYPPRNIPGTHLCWWPNRTRGRKDVNEKIPMTPSGNEPTTFRLVAQCLKQLSNHVAPRCLYISKTSALVWSSKLRYAEDMQNLSRFLLFILFTRPAFQCEFTDIYIYIYIYTRSIGTSVITGRAATTVILLNCYICRF